MTALAQSAQRLALSRKTIAVSPLSLQQYGLNSVWRSSLVGLDQGYESVDRGMSDERKVSTDPRQGMRRLICIKADERKAGGDMVNGLQSPGVEADQRVGSLLFQPAEDLGIVPPFCQ